MVISCTDHAMDKMSFLGLSIDFVEETIRKGNITKKRCQFGRKCIAKYFNNYNQTYFAVVKFKKLEIEVITVWSQNGKW